MEIMLKGIVMLCILLSTSSLGFGLYAHDLLMLCIGILRKRPLNTPSEFIL